MNEIKAAYIADIVRLLEASDYRRTRLVWVFVKHLMKE